MSSTVTGQAGYAPEGAAAGGSAGQGVYLGGGAVSPGEVAAGGVSTAGGSSTGEGRIAERTLQEGETHQDERGIAERSEAMSLSSVAPPASPPPAAPVPPASPATPIDAFAAPLAASMAGIVPNIPQPSPNASAGISGPPARPPVNTTTAAGPAPKAGRKKSEPAVRDTHTPEQRLLLLDTWQRSGLPAADFGEMVGLSKFTLYAWKARFDESGPEGLLDKPKGGKPKTKLTDLTRRTILMLKERHPDWGCRRISDMLMRGPALPASESTVARVLHEAGYQLSEEMTEPHPDKVRSFERAKPNQLWQTDLFTFILKRQNRRVYLVAFMDDHSRFIVSYGLHASQSGALVLEVLRAGIASYGAPQEILTDNGTQYVTWRGRSAFSKELQKQGIAHVVAKPHRPQTLGKVERFWGTLWRECLVSAVFVDMEEARKRIGLFVDHYNFQRPHQGIDGLVPADRFFGAAPEVYKTLKERVAANAWELARNGVPKAPFYMTGQVGGKPFAVHAEGEKVILTSPGVERQEVQLTSPESAGAEQQVQLTGTPTPLPELPEPVAPQGIVTWQLPSEDDQEEPAPGQSAIDELDQRMAHIASMTGPDNPGGAIDEELPAANDQMIEEGGQS
jgi:transposase InsO family protein